MTDAGSAYVIEQNWSRYSDEEHAVWRLLFERQLELGSAFVHPHADRSRKSV